MKRTYLVSIHVFSNFTTFALYKYTSLSLAPMLTFVFFKFQADWKPRTSVRPVDQNDLLTAGIGCERKSERRAMPLCFSVYFSLPLFLSLSLSLPSSSLPPSLSPSLSLTLPSPSLLLSLSPPSTSLPSYLSL